MSTPAHWAELFGGVVYLPEGAQDIRFLLDLYYSASLGEAVEEAGVALPIRAAQRIWRGAGRGWEWRFDEQCQAEPRLPHFTIVNVGGVFDYAYDGLDEVAAEEATFAFLGRVHHADWGLRVIERKFLSEKLTPKEREALLQAAVWETVTTLPPDEDWTAYLRHVFYRLAHPHVLQERRVRALKREPLEDEDRMPRIADQPAFDVAERAARNADIEAECKRSPTFASAIEGLRNDRRLSKAEQKALERWRPRQR